MKRLKVVGSVYPLNPHDSSLYLCRHQWEEQAAIMPSFFSTQTGEPYRYEVCTNRGVFGQDCGLVRVA